MSSARNVPTSSTTFSVLNVKECFALKIIAWDRLVNVSVALMGVMSYAIIAWILNVILQIRVMKECLGAVPNVTNLLILWHVEIAFTLFIRSISMLRRRWSVWIRSVMLRIRWRCAETVKRNIWIPGIKLSVQGARREAKAWIKWKENPTNSQKQALHWLLLHPAIGTNLLSPKIHNNCKKLNFPNQPKTLSPCHKPQQSKNHLGNRFSLSAKYVWIKQLTI